MKNNLILTSILFLPYLQETNTLHLNDLLDDFMELKGFATQKRDVLYKEWNTEDEIVECITNIQGLNKMAQKQLIFRLQQIFKSPKPIDTEQISNAGEWSLVFDYLDDTLLPIQNNGFFGLGIDRIQIADYKHRFVYNYDSWYSWRIAYANKNPKQADYEIKDENTKTLLPNAVLTNQLILKLIDKYDTKQETKKMKEADKIRFFQTTLWSVIAGKSEGDMIVLATKIAEDNHYTYQQSISDYNKKFKKKGNKIVGQNKKRSVFKSASTNDKMIYLSLDFENFQYEVCNESGTHQGIWNLSGIKTGEADPTGGHDIIIP